MAGSLIFVAWYSLFCVWYGIYGLRYGLTTYSGFMVWDVPMQLVFHIHTCHTSSIHLVSHSAPQIPKSTVQNVPCPILEISNAAPHGPHWIHHILHARPLNKRTTPCTHVATRIIKLSIPDLSLTTHYPASQNFNENIISFMHALHQMC